MEFKTDDAVEKNEKNASLKDAGIYFFMDEVTDGAMKSIIEWIFEENLALKKKKQLQLIINSPGGCLSALFATVDVINGSKVPIITTGIGQLASCGLLLFMSGKMGERVLTPNCSIMSHQYSWGSYGKHHELLAREKEFNLTHERILRLYKRCLNTKKDKKDKIINETLLRQTDTWMSPEEALEYGICDKIKNI
jgi:ATP-dependent Clp protease protease subunit